VRSNARETPYKQQYCRRNHYDVRAARLALRRIWATDFELPDPNI